MIDIKQFRKEKNIKQDELCSVLDLSQPYLSAIESGKRPLNKEKFKLLYKQYGDVVMEYKKADIVIDMSSDAQMSTVPLLPISAQGGSLDNFIVSVRNTDCERITSPIAGVDFAIPITGDSMSPEYPSGSQVLVKKINEKAFIEWGKVYVLDTCNGSVIKMLMPTDDPDVVQCVSINEQYPPFNVSMSDIYGIYRVLMLMSLK